MLQRQFKYIVLAPHLDDAVFNCWHLLNQEDTLVLTIFAGLPNKETSTIWDFLCGQKDSYKMMMNRINENEQVFKHLKSLNINLKFLDHQYHPNTYHEKTLNEAILPFISKTSHIFCPMAASLVFRHPDHIIIRNIGLNLHKDHYKVSFYNDSPYMKIPNIISKQYITKLQTRMVKITSLSGTIEPIKLNRKELSAKKSGAQDYKTQYKMTNILSLGRLHNNSNIKYEIMFHIH